ncbi:putative Transmembrane protein [Melia azedarach]|uniref:Transmembrane protein n=1 Tax=Melia azedarach TaxID=155640 RepID=A0ACC1Y1F0_MELAZ|nr:putative Transmembrane protein [Melia azedarach]
MNEIWRRRSLRFLLLFSSISLQFISAFANDSSSSEKGKQSEAHPGSKSNTGAKVVIILLAVVTVVLFSFFLFKLWQKKKREEQYARLLKLFEEDDELEVELGLRD